MSIVPGLLLALLIVAAVAFSRFAQREVPGRTVHLLRAFFPSWRFYDDFNHLPVLSFRWRHAGGEFGEWTLCSPRPQRRLAALLVNTDGNLFLAENSLVQQLVTELQSVEPEEAPGLVSYRLTDRLVRTRLPADGSAEYQFKLSVDSEDVLQSPVLER